MTRQNLKRRLAQIEAQRPTEQLPSWLAVATEKDLPAALAALPGSYGRITGYVEVSPDDWDNTP
jgi:hypothetical protein